MADKGCELLQNTRKRVCFDENNECIALNSALIAVEKKPPTPEQRDIFFLRDRYRGTCLIMAV